MNRIERNNLIARGREFLVMVILVLNSGYALMTGYVGQLLTVNILYLAFGLLFFCRSVNINRASLLFFLAITAEFAVACVANFDFANYREYIRILSIVVLALYLCSVHGGKKVLRCFCDAMFFLSIVSIVFYAVVQLFPQIGFPIVRNGYGTSYVTCYLSSINLINVERNCGPFWEPGQFAALLFLWIILEIYYIKRKDKLLLHILVCAAALITTLSTSAYVYLVLIALIVLIKRSGKSLLVKTAIILLVFAACIVVYFRYEAILDSLTRWNPAVFQKITNQNSSVTDRLLGPLTDLRIAINHPFGIGESALNNTVRDLSYRLYGTVVHTRTSTLTYFIAAFGWLSGITVLYALWRFVRRSGGDAHDRMMVLFGLLYICFSTPLNNALIFWVLLFCGVQGSASPSEVST